MVSFSSWTQLTPIIMNSKFFSACLTCCFGTNFESSNETISLLGEDVRPRKDEIIRRSIEKSRDNNDTEKNEEVTLNDTKKKEKKTDNIKKGGVLTVEVTDKSQDSQKNSTANLKYEDFKTMDSPFPLTLSKFDKDKEYIFNESRFEELKDDQDEKNETGQTGHSNIKNEEEIITSEEKKTETVEENKKETNENFEKVETNQPNNENPSSISPIKDFDQKEKTEIEKKEIEQIQKDFNEEETLRNEINELNQQLTVQTPEQLTPEKITKKIEVDPKDVAQSLRVKVESERDIRLKRLSELEEKRMTQKNENIPEYLLKQRQKIEISEDKRKRRDSGVEKKSEVNSFKKSVTESPIDKKRISGSPVPEKEEFGQHILKRSSSQIKKEEKKAPEWAIKQLQRNGELNEN